MSIDYVQAFSKYRSRFFDELTFCYLTGDYHRGKDSKIKDAACVRVMRLLAAKSIVDAYSSFNHKNMEQIMPKSTMNFSVRININYRMYFHWGHHDQFATKIKIDKHKYVGKIVSNFETYMYNQFTMSKNTITVGYILKGILEDNEIKCIQIVKTTGIPKSTFSKIISNQTPINVETDALITKALGLSQGYLLDIQKMTEIYSLRNDKTFQSKINHIKSLVPNLNVNVQ